MKAHDKNIILIGGGGHCKSCIDVIESEGKYTIAGILDSSKEVGEKIFDYKVLGSDDKISYYNDLGHYFLITLGQIKSAMPRRRIFEYLISLNAKIATVISPNSYVSSKALIKEGTAVMHGVIINAGAKVDSNCILNTGCVIEHDAYVGSNTHISTEAVINGDCFIGSDVFIGSNCTISSQVAICNNAVVGAGTVVSKTIDQEGIYVGNPARKVK